MEFLLWLVVFADLAGIIAGVYLVLLVVEPPVVLIFGEPDSVCYYETCESNSAW